MTKEIFDNQGNKIGEIKEKSKRKSGLGISIFGILLAGSVIFGPGGLVSKIKGKELSPKEIKKTKKQIFLFVVFLIIFFLIGILLGYLKKNGMFPYN